MSMPTVSFTLVRRSIAAACALLSLSMLYAPAVYATQIKYLVIPTANPTNGGTFFLPNYGNVRVTHTYSPAADFTRFHQTGAENQSAGSFSWGADTDRFSILNTHGTSQLYTVTFEFLDLQPDVSRLLLIVEGLGGEHYRNCVTWVFSAWESGG